MNPIADLNRRLNNLIRFGTIAQVDYEASRVRVKSGELLTDWLPFFNIRAASSFVWDPPEQDEQAVIFSPSGELSAGVVIYGLGSSKYPAPSADPKLHRRTYPDGAVIEYHHGNHRLVAQLPEEGTGEITAPAGFKLTAGAGIEFIGSLKVQGNIDSTGNVAAAGNISDATRSMAEDRGIYNGHTHVLPGVGTVQPPSQQQ